MFGGLSPLRGPLATDVAERENSETALGGARAMAACGKELILVARVLGLSECLFLAQSVDFGTSAQWSLSGV
jgi:hypothetical protein